MSVEQSHAQTTSPETLHEDPALETESEARSTDSLQRGKPWLDDGNLILLAGKTEFRVLKSLLISSSDVFRDMCSFVPPESIDHPDACPVVAVHDAAEDLSHILRAVFDRSYFFSRRQQPFDVVCTIARLARKYQMDSLFQEAYYFLAPFYPVTLQDWDRSEVTRRQIPTHRLLEVAQLAFSHDVPQLLPAACFMILSSSSVEELFDSNLPIPLIKLLVVGRDKLLALLPRTTLQWMDQPTTYTRVLQETRSCESVENCTAVRQVLHRRFLSVDSNAPISWLLQRMQFFYEHQPAATDGGSFCANCWRMLNQEHTRGRQNAWNRLPSIFGLKGW